jgi:hypothetical protein
VGSEPPSNVLGFRGERLSLLGPQKLGHTVPSGKRLHSNGKWQFIVDLPIENGDVP